MENLSARERLTDAFFEAIKQKPYKKITVTELVRAAGINRTSFYKYFRDVHDLYLKVSKEIVGKITDGLNEIEDDSIGDLSGFCRVYHCIRQSEENYRERVNLLTGLNGDIEFLIIYRKKLCEKLKRKTEYELKSTGCLEFNLSFVADCCLMCEFIAETKEIARDCNDIPAFIKFLPLVRRKNICDDVANAYKETTSDFSIVEYKLIRAAYNTWCEKKTHMVTVGDITKRAGISRTEFYTRYKNMDELQVTFTRSMLHAYSNVLVSLCFNDKEKIDEYLLEAEKVDRSYFIKSLFHVYVFNFIVWSAIVAEKEFYKQLEECRGTQFVEDNRDYIDLYFASLVVASSYYGADGNEQSFRKRMKIIYRFKNKFLDNYFDLRKSGGGYNISKNIQERIKQQF